MLGILCLGQMFLSFYRCCQLLLGGYCGILGCLLFVYNLGFRWCLGLVLLVIIMNQILLDRLLMYPLLLIYRRCPNNLLGCLELILINNDSFFAFLSWICWSLWNLNNIDFDGYQFSSCLIIGNGLCLASCFYKNV